MSILNNAIDALEETMTEKINEKKQAPLLSHLQRFFHQPSGFVQK
jgi:hypothetical protein